MEKRFGSNPDDYPHLVQEVDGKVGSVLAVDDDWENSNGDSCVAGAMQASLQFHVGQRPRLYYAALSKCLLVAGGGRGLVYVGHAKASYMTGRT